MRTLVSIIFVVTFFVSCSRDSANNTPSAANGIFQYKVNGNLVTINNISMASGEYAVFSKQPQGMTTPHTRYMFVGQKGVGNSWVFGIVSDSLALGNYTFDSTYSSTSGLSTVMTYNGQGSVLFYRGDFMSVNITSYSNGYIGGNFTAKFSPSPNVGLNAPDYSTRGTTLITEGQFTNIKCIY